MSIRRDDAIWLAGFTDGEGTISAYWMKNRRRITRIFKVYNSRLETLHEIVEMIGGAPPSLCGKESDTRKAVYQVQRVGEQCDAVLLSILPYLRTKRRQAEIVLHLSVMKGRYSGYTVPEKQLLIDELKTLNQRG